jgi:hypothetical protein
VVVARGALRTTYEPVIPSLPAGTEVRRAQPIGRLSSAASHCAPATCLHWGLREGETYLNPLKLLAAQPVRLLPTVPPPDGFPVPKAPQSAASPPDESPVPKASKPAVSSPAHRGPAADESSSLAPTAVVTLGALVTLGAAVLVRNH